MVWRLGKISDTVVSDTPVAGRLDMTESERGEYGGFLVAESIPPSLRPLIAAAPEMLMVLQCLEIYFHGEAGPSFMTQARELLSRIAVKAT